MVSTHSMSKSLLNFRQPSQGSARSATIPGATRRPLAHHRSRFEQTNPIQRASHLRCSCYTPAMRSDGRPNDALRPVKITRNFTTAPAGSVLWQQGGTIVLVTASITPDVPPWFREDRPGGWVTAD